MRTLITLLVVAAVAAAGYVMFRPEPSQVATVGETETAGEAEPGTAPPAASSTPATADTDDAPQAAAADEPASTEPAAPAASTALAVSGDIAEGEEIYEGYCINCHGADASGLDIYNGELERLEFVMNGGSPYMPDFAGVFTDAEIGSLHAYLVTALNEN